MKRAMVLALLGLYSMAMLAGCNTVAGAGKDIRGAGDKIEDAAKK